MNKKRNQLLFLFMLFGSISFSQTNNSLLESPKILLFFSSANFNISNTIHIKLEEKPVNSFFYSSAFSISQNNNLHYFKYEIPKGAVFCRMENHLRNTFNIWIKFRAGTDECYNAIKPQ